MSSVRVLVGTRKGAFILDSDGKRKRWDVSGPHFAGWEIYHVKGSPADPNRLYASQSSGWFGQVIQRSDDGGTTWEPVGNEFVYDGVPGTHQWYDGTPHPWEFARVWHLEPSLTDPRHGLRRRRRCGALSLHRRRPELEELSGLRDHGTGLDRGSPARAACACTRFCSIRATRSGSSSRSPPPARFAATTAARRGSPINRGLQSAQIPDPTAEVGHCVHRIAMHPSRPDVLFMQKHWDVMRSDDAGDSWHEVSGNLPTDFGFAIDVHAHEPETIYVVPIKSDSEHFPLDGKLRVYRSRTGGNEWEALTKGLPQRDCYVNVLRDAMAVDSLDSCGVYFGTTGGQVYASRRRRRQLERRSCAICRRCSRSRCRRCRDPRRAPGASADAGARQRRGALDVDGAVTSSAVLDALEARYPMLRGTIRDQVTHKRRPFVRFFRLRAGPLARSPDAPLPEGGRRRQRAVPGRRRHGRRLTPGHSEVRARPLCHPERSEA